MMQEMDDDEPIVSQPGNQSAGGGNYDATSVPIAMPAPGQDLPTERTGLTQQSQTTYNPYPQWD